MRIDEQEVYTTKEVAELLKVSMPTIKRMLRDGRLKSVRIGRQHRFFGRDLMKMLVLPQEPQQTDSNSTGGPAAG